MITIGIINLVIIGVTAGIVGWYAWETHQLRLLNVRPVLKIINKKSNGSFYIKNIGNGPALNIELRISQVHKNGGRTNLRNLLEQEQQRHFLNLGRNEFVNTKGNEVALKYIEAKESGFEHGVKDIFMLIAIYEDVYNKRYYTESLFKIIGSDYILKKSFHGEYTGKNLPNVGELDWLS